jgi:anti-sigma B factor antagonist
MSRAPSRASDKAATAEDDRKVKEEAMKIKTREVNGITILDVSGEMYGGPENMELINVATELAKEKKLDLLINLSKVKWISSTGLGILVSARSRFAKEGGVIKLCHPNDRVLGILSVTRLNMIFDVYPNEAEALGSFKK